MPQHFAAPELTSAQLWLLPVLIATVELKPETATGVSLCVREPSPSWPMLFLPQHLTVPVLKSAQEVSNPADIAIALLMPETVTG